jgi:phosphoglycolate phosphatase-like HAD superfamily hydrolase
MKNLIIVDIDSTLYCFLSAFRREASETYGKTLPHPVHIREWNGIEPYFEDFGEFLACIEKAYAVDNLEENPPYKGAVESLNKLIEQGYDIAYYTDRPASSAAATLHWLEEYGFPRTENLFICKDKKIDLIERKDEILTIIDDRPRTMIWALYELGLPKVFSLKHSYNRGLTDIPGVYIRENWNSLYTTLMEELRVGAEIS